ncbi:hypothetical protein HDZ31DRAFT_67218 [Schizophyllum fasciatum]
MVVHFRFSRIQIAPRKLSAATILCFTVFFCTFISVLGAYKTNAVYVTVFGALGALGSLLTGILKMRAHTPESRHNVLPVVNTIAPALPSPPVVEHSAPPMSSLESAAGVGWSYSSVPEPAGLITRRSSWDAAANSADSLIEPDDAWKAEVRERVRKDLNSLAQEAFRDREFGLKNAESDLERKLVQEEFDDSIAHLRLLREETIEAEIQRDRERMRYEGAPPPAHVAHGSLQSNSHRRGTSYSERYAAQNYHEFPPSDGSYSRTAYRSSTNMYTRRSRKPRYPSLLGIGYIY